MRYDLLFGSKGCKYAEIQQNEVG